MSFQKVFHLNNPFILKFTGGINLTGNYDPLITYQLGDSVSYQGSSYVAIQETIGNIPTDITYWQLLSQKGDTGDDGIGLDFIWDGTLLGVKRKDETEYQYVDLKGEKGDTGESDWEADGNDAIKPKNDKLVDYNYIKNKPDLSVYQKMSFDGVIGSFITTE